jgi:hypothetical protein
MDPRTCRPQREFMMPVIGQGEIAAAIGMVVTSEATQREWLVGDEHGDTRTFGPGHRWPDCCLDEVLESDHGIPDDAFSGSAPRDGRPPRWSSGGWIGNASSIASGH